MFQTTCFEQYLTVKINVTILCHLEIVELLPEGGMSPEVVALTAGHPLQQNPSELLAKDAVDYEVYRAEKKRNHISVEFKTKVTVGTC